MRNAWRKSKNGAMFPDSDRVRYFKAGEFEKAIHAGNDDERPLSESECRAIVNHFERELEQALRKADFPAVRRWRRRLEAFTAFCKSGFDSKSLIKPAELPAAYRGKILLITVFGGLLDGAVGLRSDDLYHRDILRNTELELQDLGLSSSRVYELGGAYWSSNPDGSIRIWGSSDEFGACDRELAAELARSLFPEAKIVAEA